MIDDIPPEFRCALALSCQVPHLGLRITMADGRAAWVSHDPAFGPVMPPCALRAAFLAPVPPAWCDSLASVEAGGPFVEVDDAAGAPIATYLDGDRVITAFATTAPPGLLTLWLDTTELPDVDTDLIDGRLHVDVELGTALVSLASSALSEDELRGAARWIVPQVSRL